MNEVEIIRRAEPCDACADIYNVAVLGTTATFDTEPQSERHPVLAAERDGRVVGWAALSKWSAGWRAKRS